MRQPLRHLDGDGNDECERQVVLPESSDAASACV